MIARPPISTHLPSLTRSVTALIGFAGMTFEVVRIDIMEVSWHYIDVVMYQIARLKMCITSLKYTKVVLHN